MGVRRPPLYHQEDPRFLQRSKSLLPLRIRFERIDNIVYDVGV